MTDSNLRELERRFRASGSVEEEAAWLRARVQAGELESGKLELAAFLGHQAAQEALGDDSPPPPPIDRWTGDTPGSVLGEWFTGLARHARPAVIRTQIAICLALTQATDHSGEDGLVARLCRAEAQVPFEPGDDSEVRPLFSYFLNSLGTAMRIGYPGHKPGLLASEGFACFSLVAFYEPLGSMENPGWERLFVAIREDVVPWALGYLAPGKAWTE